MRSLPISQTDAFVPCKLGDELRPDQLKQLFPGGGVWVFEELLKYATEKNVVNRNAAVTTTPVPISDCYNFGIQSAQT